MPVGCKDGAMDGGIPCVRHVAPGRQQPCVLDARQPSYGMYASVHATHVDQLRPIHWGLLSVRVAGDDGAVGVEGYRYQKWDTGRPQAHLQRQLHQQQVRAGAGTRTYPRPVHQALYQCRGELQWDGADEAAIDGGGGAFGGACR